MELPFYELVLGNSTRHTHRGCTTTAAREFVDFLADVGVKFLLPKGVLAICLFPLFKLGERRIWGICSADFQRWEVVRFSFWAA